MENIVDHNDTIVDGELVIDKEPNGAYVTRYLAFDLLAYHGNNIIAKPFSSRLAVRCSPFLHTDKRNQERTFFCKLTLSFC